VIEPRLFVCSGLEIPEGDPLREGRRVISLDSIGDDANVHIRLENVAKVLNEHLSPRLTDLLEIASYVFTADTATRRGQDWTNNDATEAWSRDFQFVIPVRDAEFWQSDNVQSYLIKLLGFLSNDSYAFDFRKLGKDRSPKEGYLDFGSSENWPFYGVERVIMFSGGLDSLAGAVEGASNGDKLVLISHSPVSTIISRQRNLFDQLRTKYPVPMVHIPVWINKSEDLGREHTQRTRSFLYASLGTVIAESVKADGVRFFENGVVSLNLPIADEVLQARASRTTHPVALDLFSKLASLIVERPFEVDNPYLFKTKAEVVSAIVQSSAGDLIGQTCSCAHTGRFQSGTQWHCGTCSQCIDRRIAILAAGAEAFDNENDYVSDVFTGARSEGPERNMAVNYARHTMELSRMSEVEIATRFNLEFTRAVRPFPKRRESAEMLIKTHKRHGEAAYQVLVSQLETNVPKILSGDLPESSMLSAIAGGKHLASSWSRYADRIASLLSSGIPVACASHKPKNETHLQEICDGILKSNGADLVREFPFMRWSSSLTKPDWAAESFDLLIELKYVREKRGIRRITEEIAADITKYGDNGKRVLFVIYDPNHVIVDERAFSEPVLKRADMLTYFLR
jgi:7-cyano-7-deazaguanine synthase in queuosine biosynthesis